MQYFLRVRVCVNNETLATIAVEFCLASTYVVGNDILPRSSQFRYYSFWI